MILIVVSVLLAAAITFGIIFTVKGCNSIYRDIKVGGATVKLTKFSQHLEMIDEENEDADKVTVPKTIVTLTFKVKKGQLKKSGNTESAEGYIRSFATNIEVKGCELYQTKTIKSETGDKITGFKVQFIGPPDYKVIEKDIFLARSSTY